MGDNKVKRNWLVSPTKEIEEGWLEVQIQEKISHIARKKQDIEDIMKGKIKALQMEMMMLENEKKKLESDLLRSRSTPAEEVKD